MEWFSFILSILLMVICWVMITQGRVLALQPKPNTENGEQMQVETNPPVPDLLQKIIKKKRRRPIVFLTNESSHWQKDSSTTRCSSRTCDSQFSLTLRRHHCRICGKIFCKPCCSYNVSGHIVCKRCFKRYMVQKNLRPESCTVLGTSVEDWKKAAATVNGTYELDNDKSDDITPLLQFYGVPNFLIKTARMISYHTTLECTLEGTFIIVTVSRIKTLKEDYVLDYIWHPLKTDQGVKMGRAKVVDNNVVSHVLYKPGVFILTRRHMRKLKNSEGEECEYLVNEIRVIEMSAEQSNIILKEQSEEDDGDWMGDIGRVEGAKTIMFFQRVFRKMK